MRALKIDDWGTNQRKRQWDWAQKVATSTSDAWTRRALLWNPDIDSRRQPTRKQGHPKKRWTDSITQHIHFT
eukprot:184209-Karenia_brevis.AAC.1